MRSRQAVVSMSPTATGVHVDAGRHGKPITGVPSQCHAKTGCFRPRDLERAVAVEIGERRGVRGAAGTIRGQDPTEPAAVDT